MYLPVIKLSLVFEFFSKLGFCQKNRGRTGNKLLQNFMSLHAMNLVVAASGLQQK